MKLICQKIRQESSVVVIDNFMISSNKCISSLYQIYVSFVHQIISQRPSLFRPVQNFMAEILRLEAWTEKTLEILLLSIFRHSHSQNVDFLVLVHDLEAWPSEVQNWWSSLLMLFDEPQGSSCTFLVSCLEVHDNIGRGHPHHLDMAEHHKRYRFDLIRMKMEYLLEHSDYTGPMIEGLGDDIKHIIMSKAAAFDGSLAATGEYLTCMFRTFTLSSRIAVETNVNNCAATAEIFYCQRAESLEKKPPAELDWVTKVLSWVLRAARPLQIEELAVAVAINKSQLHISEIQPHISMEMERDLKKHLDGLVSLESRRIRMTSSLAQKALKEHYARDGLILNLDADESLTSLCLHYLTLVLSDERHATWEKCLSNVSYRYQTRDARNASLDFLHYACRHWPTHFLRARDPEKYLKEQAISFLKRPGVADRWFELFQLSNGLPPNQPSGDVRTSTGQPDLAKTKPLNLTSSKTVEPFTKEDISAAAKMAGYVGLTSIIADLLHEHEPMYESEVVHVKRGYLEHDVTIWDPVSQPFIEYAIANGDNDMLKHLLQENGKQVTGYLPLHTAVLSGCLEMVQMLFEGLEDPMMADMRGRTPLHMMAICGNMEVARYLVEKCSVLGQEGKEGDEKVIDGRDEKLQSPLILAIRKGHVDTAKYLIQAGADVRVLDDTRKTALHYAVINCPQVVEDILMQEVCTVSDRDEYERTALHIAARSGSAGMTSIILVAAKKLGRLEEVVNSVDGKNRTPLHYAAEYGYEEVAGALVSHGASIEAEDAESKSAAELAAEHGHLSTLKTFVREQTENRDRLMEAASRAGQLLIVQYLLQYDVSSREENERGFRGAALSVAASWGRNHVVALLLRHGADVNWQDSDRMTPLHHASKNGFCEVVQTLLNHQLDSSKTVNIDAPDSLRYTPLHHAAMSGRMDVVRLLLEHEAKVAAQSQQRETPLHLAVGSAKLVELLLKHNAEVNSVDVLDQTPLHKAVRGRNQQSTKLLIDRGADVKLSDSEGMEPVHYAISQNDRFMVEMLCKGSVDKGRSQWSKLKLAVESNALDVLEYLVARSPAALKMEDDHNRTLLTLAAKESSVEVLTFMLDSGSDIQHSGLRGRTPLHEAVARDKVENIRKLVERGADINYPDGDGKSTLHMAAENSSGEAVSILLDGGALINMTDRGKKTALYLAVNNNNITVVRKLIERGADINIRDELGWTPLHIAIYWRSHIIVKYLIESGADISICDELGWTPLHIAIYRRSHIIVVHLIENGADPKLRTDKGSTCLDLAIDLGETENVMILLDANAPSDPGASSIWTYEELMGACQRAVRIRHYMYIKLLATKEPRLLDEARHMLGKLPDPESCLYGFRYQREKEHLPFLLDLLLGRDITLGFKELRVAVEIVEDDHWKKLQSLMGVDQDDKDQDGWNIHHFLHQTGQKVTFAGYDLGSLQLTKKPSALISPSRWQTVDSQRLSISADGVAASFGGK